MRVWTHARCCRCPVTVACVCIAVLVLPIRARMTGRLIMPTDTPHHCGSEHQRIGAEWQRVATGWRKWEASFAGSTWPLTLALVRGVDPQPGQRILDIGCGSGEPALSFASAVAPTGTVLGIDLAEAMLATARDRAAVLGLSNVAFRCVALEELDHTDGGFDAAVARFSVIFFPSMPAGLGAVYQLLKPGGCFGLAVWTPLDRNPMFAVAATVMRELTGAKPPPPDAPGPHRLSADGELEHALRSVGFEIDALRDVAFYNFAATVDDYLRMMTDMSPSLGRQLDDLGADDRATAIERIRANVAAFEVGGVVRVPALARVAVARKPA